MEEDEVPEPEPEEEPEAEYEERHIQPAAVVINTPSTGRKVITQITSDILIETELPFEESFQENVEFLVDQTIRLADRVLTKPKDDMMFG